MKRILNLFLLLLVTISISRPLYAQYAFTLDTGYIDEQNSNRGIAGFNLEPESSIGDIP